jgi:hypothetical protein
MIELLLFECGWEKAGIDYESIYRLIDWHEPSWIPVIPRNVADVPGDALTPGNSYGPGSHSMKGKNM